MLNAFAPYSDFRVTATEVLQYLQRNFGFALWMVTRTEGDDWIVLQAEDQGYGVQEGDVFRWTDSFCSQMVQGSGPNIAPISNQVPAYAAAPIGQQVSIAAYIGLPLTKPDGTLFGTLCAIDPQAQCESLNDALPQLQLICRMLGTVLSAELKAESEMRRAERAEAEAETDSLTGLYNRRGWDRLLDAEESRCGRYGHAAAVVSIDMDNFKQINDLHGHSAGDRQLQEAARALRQAARGCDVVARVGGDEFAVLAVHCDQQGAQSLVTRTQEAFSQLGLQGSMGIGLREPSKTLNDAWIQADANMYRAKRRGTPIKTTQVANDLGSHI
ncbi:MAG: sensor domain-containing diguanylate cyclase [Pirellulaceae bacterium]|nr:sensor domain-containing diguanylate cyclase [Pirellulaceae bacterium]